MEKILAIFLAVTLQFVLLSFHAISQETKWVVVEGMASMENMTKEEARKLAVEDAMRKAVEEAVGVDILCETLVFNLKVAEDIIKALPYGKVLDKEIIEEGVRETGKKGKPIPASEYRIKMKSKVFMEEGKADPHFKIAASFNKSFFNEGDEMEIRISSTKDCYLNIFNVLEDERVLILIPNHYRRESFVKANEAFIFPNDEDKRRGIKLKIHGLEGRKSIREAIYILGLQRPLRSSAVKYREGIYNSYAGQTGFIKDLVKEIIGIPPSERAEKFIQYQVLR